MLKSAAKQLFYPMASLRLGGNVVRYSTLVALLLVTVFFSIATAKFFTTANLTNILSQISLLTLVATGLCFAVASGGIDLSVAVAFDLGSMAAIMILKLGFGWYAAIAAALVTGALIGIFNSFLVLKARITMFLATLGTLFIGESIEKIVTTGGSSIYLPGMDEVFKFLGRGSLFVLQQTGGRIDLKFSVLLAIIVAGIGHFILSRTTFGRGLYALGSQQGVALLSGVPVSRYTTYALILCSSICAFAGLVSSSVLTAYVPLNGRYYLMDAIGAVFIGSTLHQKGFANIPGTLVGVLFYGIIANGLNLIGINFYWQSVARGLLIFVILALDSYRVNHVDRAHS